MTTRSPPHRARGRPGAMALGWAIALGAALLPAREAGAQDGAALQAQHAALQGALAASPFGRPLLLESRDRDGHLEGRVHALVGQPFAVVARALRSAPPWCDLLYLHLNVKQCTVEGGQAQPIVALAVGQKNDQALSDAYRLKFAFDAVRVTGNYLHVSMHAPQGPLGTSDYRINIEATPAAQGQTFLRMRYAYRHGVAARVAMQAYLATTGRDKVGFSLEPDGPDGAPLPVRGVRGVVERNTMRYYLALDAYLTTLSSPPARQFEERLRRWHAATERYAAQLRELDLGQYLALKGLAAKATPP
ncbi:MAG TPA: hypothetical protein VFQ20_11085 [Burkholderiaceae bacterium]|nr:hypothetical protein [Burkholderiaceae bacterium]